MKRDLIEIEMYIDECNSRIRTILEERAILEKEMLIVLRGTRFYCPDCGRKSTLSKWTFIQTSHYERPHGCGEGDTWQTRPARECGIRCPKCGGYFYIPRLTHRGKLLKIMEKVGHIKMTELFKCVEEMKEEDLLTRK